MRPPLAMTLKADDDAQGEELGKARKDAREAAYPDRPLGPVARTDIPKVAEGWRYRWPELTGNRMQFVFFLNRDNALLSATAFAPDPARCPGRRPLVVIGTGYGVDAEIRKWWAGQALAEAGYVALTFDYLNQGFSEATGHSNPDGTGTPIPPACGDAACTRGADDRFGGLLDAQDAISFALSTPSALYRGGFEGQDGDTVFPFHEQVDADWIGYAGHSRGAKIASVLPGLDSRLDAVVAWDNLSRDLEGDAGSASSTCMNGGLGFASGNILAEPRVPSMGQAGDNNQACGDPQLKKTAYFYWQEAGQAVIQVVLANADHNTDWGTGPNSETINPWGTDLPAYYTIAWFDRWLTSSGDDALRRLTADLFELFEHYAGAFTPTATEALSDFYFSSLSIPGQPECVDLRTGCTP